MLATILQVAGVGSLVIGGFLVWTPLGFFLAGAGLVLFGLALERSK